jgi:hypothetical protein
LRFVTLLTAAASSAAAALPGNAMVSKETRATRKTARKIGAAMAGH